MRFFDFHVHSSFSEGKSSIEEIAERAKFLGFFGICIANYFREFSRIEELKDSMKKISKEFGVELYLGFEARNIKELNMLCKNRKKFDVLLVSGGDLRLNRIAVETPEVDILTHPEYGRKDSGLNHILAKIAAENNVAIEINFREVLISSKNTRAHILHNISRNVQLCKKYKVPMVLCSGAITHWELRDPKILTSFGILVGLELNESKKCLSYVPEQIIKNIKERQNEKWIMSGVRVVK